jgi:hypothetical protein
MPPTITEVFPPIPLNELVTLVDDFPSMTVFAKKAALDRVVAAHPITNLEWGSGWRYRRCRKLELGNLPENISELIWRKDKPADLGRANPAGFQVMYLADRVDTALCEARVEDDLAVVAEFVIQNGRSIRVAPIGELALLQRSGRGFLSGDVGTVASEMLNACKPEEARALLISDAFLLDCMVGHDEYEISSHLALAIFKKNPAISAIGYPSRRQFGAINFAVRVEDFWDNWAFSSARIGHATHLTMSYFDFQGARSVNEVFNDGRIRWVDTGNPHSTLDLQPPYFPQI